MATGSVKALKSIGSAANEVATAAQSAATKIGVAGAAMVTALATAGIKYNSEIETYTANFQTMLGSAEAAQKRVTELRDMAASTPFGLADLASGTQTLLAYGVAADQTTEILQTLGDVSLGDGNKLTTLTTVYGQIASLGKLQAQDWKQLLGVGFNPLTYIAERTGETMEELQDRMSDGGITIDEVTQAFQDATSEGGQFYKAMDTASKTTSGLTSTLKDNFSALAGTVMSELSGNLTTTVLPKAIEYVQSLQNALESGDTTAQKLSNVQKTLGDILNEIVDSVDISAVNAGVQYGSVFFSNLIGNLNKNLPTLAAEGKQLWTSLLLGIQMAAMRLKESASIISAETLSSWIATKSTFLAVGLEILGGIAEGITADFQKGADSQIVSALTSGLTSAFASAGETIPALITAGGEMLKGICSAISSESGKESLKSALVNIGNSIVDLVTDPSVWKAIGEAGLAIGEALLEGIGNALGGLFDSIMQLFGIGGKQSSGTPVKVSETTSELAEERAEALSTIDANRNMVIGAAADVSMNGKLTSAYNSRQISYIAEELGRAVKTAQNQGAIGADTSLDDLFSIGETGITRAKQGADYDAIYQSITLAAMENFSELTAETAAFFDDAIEQAEKAEEAERQYVEAIKEATDIVGSSADMMAAPVEAMEDAGAAFGVNLEEELSKYLEMEDAANGAVQAAQEVTAAIEAIPESKTVTINVDMSTIDPALLNSFGLGSHASGLDYVPRDNYMARLHRGEMVLTQGEANDYRASAFNADSVRSNGTNDDKAISVYLGKKAVAAAIKREMGTMIGNRNLQQVMARGG